MKSEPNTSIYNGSGALWTTQIVSAFWTTNYGSDVWVQMVNLKLVSIVMVFEKKLELEFIFFKLVE
jgi:hypothetical protein